jgi:excisionase family DNA binding protein
MSATYGQSVRLLTTGELARELGVSRGAVLKWANDGLITPAFTTPGGHLRWDLDDVRRQVRELRQRPTDGE